MSRCSVSACLLGVMSVPVPRGCGRCLSSHLPCWCVLSRNAVSAFHPGMSSVPVVLGCGPRLFIPVLSRSVSSRLREWCLMCWNEVGAFCLVQFRLQFLDVCHGIRSVPLVRGWFSPMCLACRPGMMSVPCVLGWFGAIC